MRVWSIALFVVVCARGLASGVDGSTPAEVQARIRTDGARATLGAIYGDPAAWPALLSAVASGGAEWLAVANALHAAADAGPSEQLTLAVGEALGHQPQQVLSTCPGEFGLAALCGGPDVDDPRFNSYDRSMAAIAARQRALRVVSEARLLSARDSCITTLESSKAGIARFFGMTK